MRSHVPVSLSLINTKWLIVHCSRSQECLLEIIGLNYLVIRSLSNHCLWFLKALVKAMETNVRSLLSLTRGRCLSLVSSASHLLGCCKIWRHYRKSQSLLYPKSVSTSWWCQTVPRPQVLPLSSQPYRVMLKIITFLLLVFDVSFRIVHERPEICLFLGYQMVILICKVLLSLLEIILHLKELLFVDHLSLSLANGLHLINFVKVFTCPSQLILEMNDYRCLLVQKLLAMREDLMNLWPCFLGS